MTPLELSFEAVYGGSPRRSDTHRAGSTARRAHRLQRGIRTADRDSATDACCYSPQHEQIVHALRCDARASVSFGLGAPPAERFAKYVYGCIAEVAAAGFEVPPLDMHVSSTVRSASDCRRALRWRSHAKSFARCSIYRSTT